MNKNYLIRLVVSTILFLPLKHFSQSHLIVTPNSTATQLAQTITGSGVTVSSATLHCAGQAEGNFSYSGSNLGLTNGIILSSGMADSAVYNPSALQYPPSYGFGTSYTDPNLTAISSTATNDVCILGFDFVPVCNTLNITFVFASSEYDGFVCEFNDAFGIFLTGPNPSGGNYTATNIATLPSGTPVAINNVNDGGNGCSPTNSSYFVNNLTVFDADSNMDIAYPGYTIPITSVTSVSPCASYHMEIAIADAGDDAYDSGVFIEGNSVSCSTAPAASIASTTVSCGGSAGTASVTVINYTATPTYSWSPGGQTTSSITGLTAGTYTCLVGFVTACAGVYTQTLTTTINNPSTFTLSPSSSPAGCSGSATGSATVTISGGTAPYTIAWSTTPVQTTTTVANLTPGTYTIGVHDNAGCSQVTTVNVGIASPTTLSFTTTSVCGNNALLMASSGYSYQWYDTLNNIIPGATAQTYTASNVLNGQHYIVSYKDNITGCKDSTEITISKYNLSFLTNASPTCHGGNNGSISLNPTGTYTFSSYSWDIAETATNIAGTSTTTPISVSNLAAGIYTVAISPTGNASCLYTYTLQVLANVLPPPTLTTYSVCNQDTLHFNPPVAAGSTNNWYLSTSTVTIGSSAANVSFYNSPCAT